MCSALTIYFDYPYSHPHPYLICKTHTMVGEQSLVARDILAADLTFAPNTQVAVSIFEI